MAERLVVVRKIEERHLMAAAEIMYDGFERKMRPVLGRKGSTLPALSKALAVARVLGALRSDELLGVCVLVGPMDRGMSFATRTFFIRYLGFGRWLRRLLDFAPTWGRARVAEVYIDGLAVRADRRGIGVGTALLREAFVVARELGAERLRLQVVDTNPRAQALYERLGFRAVKRQRIPIIGPVMGFNAYTTMVRPVVDEAG